MHTTHDGIQESWLHMQDDLQSQHERLNKSGHRAASMVSGPTLRLTISVQRLKVKLQCDHMSQIP